MMFGLIKKLREKDERIGELLNELDRARRSNGAITELNLKVTDALTDTRAKHKREMQVMQNKYSHLYEKYLNLLERYEKALKGVE